MCRVQAEIGTSLKRSFVSVDKRGFPFIVNIYNLSNEKNYIHPGDELGISDAVKVFAKCSFGQYHYELPIIRVENPFKVLINGDSLPANGVTTTWMSTRLQ